MDKEDNLDRAKRARLDGPHFSDVFTTSPTDNLYHLGMTTASHDLVQLFGDTEVVCMMGSAVRAEVFAKKHLHPVFGGKSELDSVKPFGTTERGSLFKVGKVISMSHGMGNPSTLIFLHEVAKLMYHAKADFSKLRFIRLGTSGGVGVPGGTVVLTDQPVDAELKFGYEHVSLGVKTRHSCHSDHSLNEAILASNKEMVEKGHFRQGHTMATDDYYEGQGRRDGALQPWYSEQEKLAFLQKASKLGVVNIEMESCAFLYFFNRLGVRATIIAVALLDRLQGDQHDVPTATIKEWGERPLKAVTNYLKTSVS